MNSPFIRRMDLARGPLSSKNHEIFRPAIHALFASFRLITLAPPGKSGSAR